MRIGDIALLVVALCFTATTIMLNLRINGIVKEMNRLLKKQDDKNAAIDREAFEWLRRLEKQIEDLPLDQIQTIYDSEQQFQEGLNSILNYYGPPKENETK